MQIMAERIVLETSDTGEFSKTKTVYEVQPGETVEALLQRMQLTGTMEWHYSEAHVRLKLVKPPK